MTDHSIKTIPAGTPLPADDPARTLTVAMPDDPALPHLDKSDFGIDFIRNGRKIEIGTKDLFIWNDGETQESEYPIDDPRSRGRFIGEIHLDHCQVSYTKNRFERDDPAWAEMVRVVRGEGPLRPNAARLKGYEGNQSPLYKLFQAFRRGQSACYLTLGVEALLPGSRERKPRWSILSEGDGLTPAIQPVVQTE